MFIHLEKLSSEMYRKDLLWSFMNIDTWTHFQFCISPHPTPQSQGEKKLLHYMLIFNCIQFIYIHTSCPIKMLFKFIFSVKSIFLNVKFSCQLTFD